MRTRSGDRPAPPPGTVATFMARGSFQGDYFKGLPLEEQDIVCSAYWIHLHAVLHCGTARRFDGSEGERICLFKPGDKVQWVDINTIDLMAVWGEVSSTSIPIADWPSVKAMAISNGACEPVL